MSGEEEVTIRVPRSFQGVALYTGGATPLLISDDWRGPENPVHRIQRAVAIARLRAIADLLEESP